MKTKEKKIEKATFAWWCFWCLESVFDSIPGISETEVGYAWWKEENPTYEEVYSGKTWHREAIQILYNPEMISYDDILVEFWSQIDPTDSGWQFADRWFSYTTAIWYHNEDQKNIAKESKKRLVSSNKFSSKIVTEILPFTTFYKAEEYHQKYYLKSSFRYDLYRKGSWRDDFINDNWSSEAKEYLRWKDAFLAKKYKKISNSELKGKIPEISYKVTQEEKTETPYTSEFSTEWKSGIYVDIVSWEPLFSSIDQYDAGCWWPSFTKPISSHFLKTKEDYKIWVKRIEVRSKYGDSHLGHVFDDGPIDTGRLRYCINWAALRFIPKEKLKDEWYEEYLNLFD